MEQAMPSVGFEHRRRRPAPVAAGESSMTIPPPRAQLLLLLLLFCIIWCRGGGRIGRLQEEALQEVSRGVGLAGQPPPASNSTGLRWSGERIRHPRRTEMASAPLQKASPERKEVKRAKRVKRSIVGFVGGAGAGIVSGVVVSVVLRVLKKWCRRRRGGGRGYGGMEIFSPEIQRTEHLEFLEKEKGFSSFEIVGRGASGEVYKVELPGSDGKLIAIKKIINRGYEGSRLGEEDNQLLRQIRSEIQIVGQIHHRNLLPLLAHLPRADCDYLIYEFMKNGSLHDVLDQVSAGKRTLGWGIRHRIAGGIAAGLEYLHLHHNPRIIHRDLKPANILLTDDLEPRIADFGLAKALPELKTHMTTSNVVGTLGFIAPEYHQTLKFTDKCDIYSFGVLLASLIVGKLPSDHFFQQTQEMSLVKWLRNVMTSGDPVAAIDPTLIRNGHEEEEEEEEEEEMVLVLKIACFCTVEDPSQRPDSKQVRSLLRQVKSRRRTAAQFPACRLRHASGAIGGDV